MSYPHRYQSSLQWLSELNENEGSFRTKQDWPRMIFGFNTDIRHNETVYHVQSEAREADFLLQTQVFVRGRCIGKFARSYAEDRQQAGFSDDSMHELLKTQHRATIEAVRAGNIERYLADSSDSSRASESSPSNGQPS